MARIISPPRSELVRLRQPLTRGERLVFDFLDTHLPDAWEIYVQPHLNGLRPDFVLLHPRVGIAVFEVKDWNLDAMEYYVLERPGKAPELFGRKDGRSFSLQSQNPVKKVYLYKREINELYCPRLHRRAGLAVITAGIIFPFAKGERVRKLLHPFLRYRGMDEYGKYNPVSGMEALQSGNVGLIFPEGLRKHSSYMNPNLAKDLRNWLVEPDFSATQRKPLLLDNTQRNLVMTRTITGYRRIKE